MKTIRSIIVTSICLISLASCTKDIINGSGPEVNQVRNTGNFTGIELALNATVNYTQDSVFKVELKGQQNVLNQIQTEVSSSQFIIKLPWDTKLVSYAPITINISAPGVNAFNVSGSGTMQSVGNISVTNADFNISGSGSIHIGNIVASDIDTRVSGSGTVEIAAGTSTSQSMNISGSGLIDVLGVTAKTATTYTSGSGDIKLTATENLEAHISGSGKVYYTGNPVIDSNISGSGKLIHL